jgi:hypothetical protein
MELVDRYLQAVRFWLPREQQDDVARELSDDILSQIEEEERALGRLMTPDEVEAVLKRRGRPFVVANSFLPQRQLIGPLLFPMYTFVLKLIGVVYVIPWIIVWTCLLAFFPAYRGHVERDLGTLWSIVVQIFAAVTILFAILEHTFGAAKLLTGDWDPHRLPAVRERDANRIPRASSIAEVVCNLLFIAWWAGGFPLFYGPFWISGTIFPEFHQRFFFPVLFLAMITATLAVVNLVRPYWTRARRAIRAFTNGAMAAITGWAAVTHSAAVRTSLHRLRGLHGAAPPAAVAAIVDASVLIVLAVIAVATAITCARDLYLATASSTYGTTSKLRS